MRNNGRDLLMRWDATEWEVASMGHKASMDLWAEYSINKTRIGLYSSSLHIFAALKKRTALISAGLFPCLNLSFLATIHYIVGIHLCRDRLLILYGNRLEKLSGSSQARKIFVSAFKVNAAAENCNDITIWTQCVQCHSPSEIYSNMTKCGVKHECCELRWAETV